MYLVEGTEKAALIDTGSGFGSLKAVVDQLTNKPVVVLLTHGHTDHAMGSAEFSEVYMNLEDEYIYGPHGDKAFRHEGMSLAESVGRTYFASGRCLQWIYNCKNKSHVRKHCL